VTRHDSIYCSTTPFESWSGTVSLVASPAPGWALTSWTGCDRVQGNVCELAVPATWRSATVRARFDDVSAPQLKFTEPVGRDGGLDLRWKADEPGVRYHCSLDGAAMTPCAPPYAVQVAEGDHVLDVVAQDTTGQASTWAYEFAYVDTSLVEAPAHAAHVPTARPRVVAQSGAGLGFDCSLDFGAWSHCADRGGELSLPALADGEHTLRVRARRGAAVDHSPVARTWTVDTKAPETTLPAASGGFTLASDEPGVTFYCRLDNAPFKPCASAAIIRRGPGRHTFEAYAVDRAGNADATPARRSWR
jgi:hypothetical protein